MVRALAGAVRFFWAATAGSRLRPWRSEYLRWRVETYSGKPAGTLRARDFVRLFTAEPGQVLRFFRWCGRLRRIANGGRG